MDINRDLFWKLLEPEHKKARAFSRKLMGNRDDGDDLYQDSLVSALSGFGSLKKIEAFRPWLYRIIINGYKNRRRDPWWKRFFPVTAEIREIPGSANPAAAYAARQRLEKAFAVLSADDRALITLRELQGWSISELALMKGKSEVNIKVRLSRARKKMREALIRYLKGSHQQETELTFQNEDKICVVMKPGEDF
jgi:RNA polymerase sigma-70 factor (ECF subfamily)